MTKQQGHISDIDIKLKDFDYKYNKLSKEFKLLKLCGFGVTFFLTVLMIGSFVANYYIWSKISQQKPTANQPEVPKSPKKSP